MRNPRLTLLPWILILAACSKDAPPSPPPLPTGGARAASSAVLSAKGGHSAGDFEGELKLLTTPSPRHGPGKSASRAWPVTLQIKHAKVRVDLPDAMAPSGLAGGIHVVMNAPAKQLFAVLEGRKQVVTLTLASLGEQLESLKPPGRPSAPGDKPGTEPRITMTGHHDTVAGRDCEDWDIAKPGGDKLQMCVANEGAAWFELPTLGLPTEHAWALALLDGKHLPLRAIAFDASGTETGRIEVTRIERKPVPDGVFAMPAGYQVVDMATMMREMMASALPTGEPTAPGAEGAANKPPPGLQGMIEKMRERARKQRQVPSNAP